MKTLSFLSIFLFSILLCEARKAPNPVLDINGTIVRAGVEYVVIPLDSGGVLELAPTANQSCPESVIQDFPHYRWGAEIEFYPVNPKKGVVREWTDINIEFPNLYTGCPQSNVWSINGDPSSYDITHYVVAGGEKGSPGQKTLSNWFKIVKTENAYKFTFCPSVCNYCSYVCQDVGISIEGGQRRLVLSDTPLEVIFKKA